MRCQKARFSETGLNGPRCRRRCASDRSVACLRPLLKRVPVGGDFDATDWAGGDFQARPEGDERNAITDAVAGKT